MLRLLYLVNPMPWIELNDDRRIPTDEIVYELSICWEEYSQNKSDPETNEAMAFLVQIAAARMYIINKRNHFLIVGLIVTNVLWALNKIGGL